MMGGHGSVRFFLQPVVAIALGVWHGLRDHRLGRPAYVIGLIHARGERLRRLREGMRDVAVPICIALLASYAFQYIVQSRISISHGLMFATLFVAMPYFLARGLANRLSHRPNVTKRA
jgi:hypothetical protein